MDLVERLNIFTKSQGISSSILADSCGIPRPTVSQLLNGRNKKISDDIISRIHRVYPQLSIMWLMFGEGEMLVAENNQFSEPQNDTNDGFSQPYSPESQQGNLFSNTENPVQNLAPDNSSPISGIINMMSNGEKSNFFIENSDKKESISITPDSHKKITNIVVFYSDNSFQSFSPSQN